MYAGYQENLWYIDSGCSKHITSDKDNFVYFNEIKKEKNVNFGNNSSATIKEKGFVVLKEKVKVENVLFVNGIRHNQLSVS